MQEKGQVGGNARVVREFVAYLRVEKGLRPASCEAYQRDLEQFAEHVEGRDGLLVGATQADVSGFMEGLRGHGGGVAVDCAEAELSAWVLSVAADG